MKLKIYGLHERGMCFSDIALKIGGISAHDVGLAVVDVQIARKNYQRREKIIYRKRLNNPSPTKFIQR